MAADLRLNKELAMAPPLPVFTKYDPVLPDWGSGVWDHPVPPTRPLKSLHQAVHVTWLGSDFEDELAGLFSEHAEASPLAIGVAALVLQSAYVNTFFQAAVAKLATPFGNFRAAEPKGVPRATEKVTNPDDYYGQNGVPPGKCWDWRSEAVHGIQADAHGDPQREHAKATARVRGSVGSLLDCLRCSLETTDNTAQEQFINTLRRHQGGKVFKALRQKSTLHVLSDVKQCLMNFLFTPSRGGKALTFGDLARDPAFQLAAEKTKQDNKLGGAVFRAAVALLKHPALAGAPIQMVVEVQLYLDVFLRERKVVHAFYKLARANSLMSLTMDCVKFAAPGNRGTACSDEDAAGRVWLKMLGIDYTGDVWDLNGRCKTADDLRNVSVLLACNTVKHL